MASAPVTTKEALGAGMERPLIPGEFDSTRDDYPDTGVVSQQKVSRPVDSCCRLV
jgi:hypothetical protein